MGEDNVDLILIHTLSVRWGVTEDKGPAAGPAICRGESFISQNKILWSDDDPRLTVGHKIKLELIEN